MDDLYIIGAKVRRLNRDRDEGIITSEIPASGTGQEEEHKRLFHVRCSGKERQYTTDLYIDEFELIKST